MYTFTRVAPWRRLFAVILLLALPLAEGLAQVAPNSIQWKSLGPNNLGGRIRSILVDGNGAVWACSPGGGLFRSTNRGQSWAPVDGFTNAQGSPCLAAVSIAQDARGHIYVGTGELGFNVNFLNTQVGTVSPRSFNNFRNGYKGYLGQPGHGVFVSTDGGNTFSNVNATWRDVLPSRLFDDTNPWVGVQKLTANGNRVFAATIRGLFYSDDAFQTVVQATDTFTDGFSLSTHRVMDVEVAADGRIFASTSQATFISDDNGQTFTRRLRGADLPRDPFDVPNRVNPPSRLRVEIAVAPSDRKVVYITEVNPAGYTLGVWKSSDNGETWTQIGPRSTAIDGATSQTFAPLNDPFSIQGLGEFALMLAVHPTDPDRIFFGGATWWEYTPTTNWTRKGTRFQPFFPGDPKYVPLGIHCFAYDTSTNPPTFYWGTEKEFIRSTTDANTFDALVNGLNITHAWSVTTSPAGRIATTLASRGLTTREAQSNAGFREISLTQFRNGFLQVSQWIEGLFIAGFNEGVVRRTFNFGEALEEICLSPDETLDPLPVPNAATERFCFVGTGNTERFPGSATNNSSILTPVALVEYIANADSIVQDTTDRILGEQVLFTANGFGLWRITSPFATVANNFSDGVGTATVITPFFQSDPTWGYPTAMDVSRDGLFTAYVGTNLGKIFRVRRANDPTHPDFGFQDITPDFAELPQWPQDREQIDPTYSPQFVSSIRINPANPENVVVTFGGYEKHNEYLDVNDPNFPTYEWSNIFSTFNGNDPNKVEWYSQFVLDAGMPYGPIYDVVFNEAPDRNPGWELALATEFGIYVLEAQRELRATGDAIVRYVAQNGGDMAPVPVFGFYTKRTEIERITYPGSERRATRLKRLPFPQIYVATQGRGLFTFDLINDRRATIAQAAAHQVRVFPNPARNEATILVSADLPGAVQVRVMDISGRVVRTQQIDNVAAGEVALPLSLAGCTSGMYMVETIRTSASGTSRQVTKLVVTE